MHLQVLCIMFFCWKETAPSLPQCVQKNPGPFWLLAMASVLALARTDGLGVCCSHLISMLQILNEVFTEPFVLRSAALHIRGQLGAGPDMPIWHPSTDCPVSRTWIPLALALYWMEAVSVGILPSSVELRELPKLEFSTLGTQGRKTLALASESLGAASLNARALLTVKAPEMWMVQSLDSQWWEWPYIWTPHHIHCLSSHAFIEHLLCKLQFKIFISFMWSTHCEVYSREKKMTQKYEVRNGAIQEALARRPQVRKY